MRALVTGGAGFIGSHVVSGLLWEGHQVLVLDDLSSGTAENLQAAGEQIDRAGLIVRDLEFIRGDIQDLETIRRALQGVDVVFHLAAQVSVPVSLNSPTNCYDVNVKGSLNLLSSAQTAGVKRVVLASSAAVYGDSDVPLGEDAAKNPLSPYAGSKWAMEQTALMFHRLYGLEVVCLRYFNVFGPRQRPDSHYAAVIPAFIRAMDAGRAPTIYGDGEQRRDFVHVDDVVQANLLSARSEHAAGQILNISSGEGVTIRKLAGILQDLIPDASGPIYKSQREGDIYFSEAVIERAWRALGYRPKVALVEGLQSAVEWFRQERLRTPQ